MRPRHFSARVTRVRVRARRGGRAWPSRTTRWTHQPASRTARPTSRVARLGRSRPPLRRPRHQLPPRRRGRHGRACRCPAPGGCRPPRWRPFDRRRGRPGSTGRVRATPNHPSRRSHPSQCSRPSRCSHPSPRSHPSRSFRILLPSRSHPYPGRRQHPRLPAPSRPVLSHRRRHRPVHHRPCLRHPAPHRCPRFHHHQ